MNTATAPATLAGIHDAYDRIAPPPGAVPGITAKRLAQYLTACGLRRNALAQGRPSATDAEAARVAMAAARAVEWIRQTYPGIADTFAGSVASAWPGTGDVDDWLVHLAASLGIDAATVTGLASLEGAILAARQADAEFAARALDRTVGSHERVMYAALIDISRGDPEAAQRILGEQLDGYDDEPWNGTDTGVQWLDRTRAERVPGTPVVPHECRFPTPNGNIGNPQPCETCGKTFDQARADAALAEARERAAAAYSVPAARNPVADGNQAVPEPDRM